MRADVDVEVSSRLGCGTVQHVVTSDTSSRNRSIVAEAERNPDISPSTCCGSTFKSRGARRCWRVGPSVVVLAELEGCHLPLAEDPRVGFVAEVEVARWPQRPEEHQDDEDEYGDDVFEVWRCFVGSRTMWRGSHVLVRRWVVVRFATSVADSGW